jgi:hypothetical protein
MQARLNLRSLSASSFNNHKLHEPFAPGGDFDWMLMHGASGQEMAAGAFATPYADT